MDLMPLTPPLIYLQGPSIGDLLSMATSWCEGGGHLLGYLLITPLPPGLPYPQTNRVIWAGRGSVLIDTDWVRWIQACQYKKGHGKERAGLLGGPFDWQYAAGAGRVSLLPGR